MLAEFFLSVVTFVSKTETGLNPVPDFVSVTNAGFMILSNHCQLMWITHTDTTEHSANGGDTDRDCFNDHRVQWSIQALLSILPIETMEGSGTVPASTWLIRYQFVDKHNGQTQEIHDTADSPSICSDEHFCQSSVRLIKIPKVWLFQPP